MSWKAASMRWRSTRMCRPVSRATGCSRVSPCRAISTRSRCWSGARRWSGRWPKSAPRSGAARSCSISGTAFCRRRRRNTWPRWPGCSPSRLPHPGTKTRADVSRRAVVLMNLGGPDSPEAVRPFLYNLFSDKAIIRLPAPLRLPLAALIASRRAATARGIYAQLGGSSPLLANTKAQARALEQELSPGYRCFIAMRYWHPLTAAAVSEVKQWRPDEIVLLPLYPQFSTTTTKSSLALWEREARRQRLDASSRSIRSYPDAPGFVAALAASTREALDAARYDGHPIRLLLSAHGLPERIVKAGDPYPREVATTAAALLRALASSEVGSPGIDSAICYQSRVGPLAWTGPSVEEELRRAGLDRVGVIVVPISFVSEHSGTLVELDREYRYLAERSRVPSYRRVPTVGADSRFISALADLVRGLVRGAETRPNRS